jgi:hypothetical protein
MNEQQTMAALRMMVLLLAVVAVAYVIFWQANQ